MLFFVLRNCTVGYVDVVFYGFHQIYLCKPPLWNGDGVVSSEGLSFMWHDACGEYDTYHMNTSNTLTNEAMGVTSVQTVHQYARRQPPNFIFI